MSLEIVIVPCLADNYAYLVKSTADPKASLIDAPEDAAIDAALRDRGWDLGTILITHHHADHVDGVPGLLARYDAEVIGPAVEIAKLPKLDRAVAEGDTGGSGVAAWQVLEVPGHTLGHIAYHFATAGAVFTADSLMALGCGRVFEGTPQTMWESLRKLAALPPETQVYSGHEYTQTNAAFALTVEPDNAALTERAQAIGTARAAGRPTVPVSLALELDTNPFLRAHLDRVKQAVGMAGAADAEVFAEIRHRKDRF
ncbi:MAG: hydroxyacylglutathione hydrolase [Pseudomonadota bacterium]